MTIKYIDIYKNLKKEKPEQPDYRTMAKVNNEYIEIGAAWIKQTKPSENFPEGRQYLSVKLDETKVELNAPTTSAGTPLPSFDNGF